MSGKRDSRAHLLEQLEPRRLLSGGTLDPTFGSNGIAMVSPGSFKFPAVSVASRSDGKVIVLGYDESAVSGVFTVPRVTLARFNTNGTLDTTFGNKGIAIASFLPDWDQPYALALQSDNKILVAGYHLHGDLLGEHQTDAEVMRFTANGQLDTTFGNNRMHTATFNFGDGDDSEADAIAIQRDGKIVIAGRALDSGILSVDDRPYIARLNSNGTLDASFADNGINILDIGDGLYQNMGQALAIDYNGTSSSTNNGKIVLAGQTTDGSTTKFFTVRFSKSGKVDGSFGHGIVTTQFSSALKYNDAHAVVIQSDSKVVVAGAVGAKQMGAHNFGIMRFNNDGTMDKSFGGSSTGKTQVDFGGDDQARSMVINATGEVLVGGASDSKTALVLLNKVGRIDPVFGPNANGRAIVAIDKTTIAAGGIALSRNRTFVVAGGDKFTTERFYDRAAATVSIKRVDDASETNKAPGSFMISRAEKLNTTTRVYFTLGGSATSPFSLFKSSIDYTGPVPAPPPVIGTGGSSGISHAGQAYVDIPPGQTSTSVTIVPNDDTRVEPDEAVIATLVVDPGYDVKPSAPSAVIAIHDNDGTRLKPTADAYVHDGTTAGTNFGTATDLEVKKGGSGFNRISYLKFDLSNVSTINSVKLDLFGKLSDTQNASVATSLFSVANTSWTETGITFTNAPAAGSSALATATITGTTLQKVEFDVTAYVKAQFTAGHKVVAFALMNSATSSSLVQFNSREAASQTPALVIA